VLFLGDTPALHILQSRVEPAAPCILLSFQAKNRAKLRILSAVLKRNQQYSQNYLPHVPEDPSA